MKRRALVLLIFPFVVVSGVATRCFCTENPFTGSTSCSDTGDGSGGGGGGPLPSPTPPRTPTPTATPSRTPVPPATPTPSSYFEENGGEYSYGTTCQNGTEIDPITTVFMTNASETNIISKFRDIGMNTGPGVGTTKQNYRDNGGCVQGEISQATDDAFGPCVWGLCANSRWHARCNVYSQPGPTGTWATCTPHWDSGEGVIYDSCVHFVPATYDGNDNYTGSGFDAGRDWLWWQLVHERGQGFNGVQNYANVQVIVNVQAPGIPIGPEATATSTSSTLISAGVIAHEG